MADVILSLFEITAASSPDIELTTATTPPNGSYALPFAASCAKMYGLQAAYPYHIVKCSRCPVWPLSEGICGGGSWPLELWVER